ncbi:hypothetical protein SARC_09336 [Sphaeroforma arctica JP610]|uniref:Uncharacterized protein n=1 Tax=Sphaeroforma arctica JP610 TaxID=667725 RepID=A0A0L0FNC3_9EUKA|nr:hypothetical protein SARC_09336 [Sphaeroforma arctica JP610]KNC78224.1 hypothetical protein SARC_09336 [Sphaeroforma arctica JP610]|eukprot:XP_014152126.1 hypothetical protein SARC_09336 [Sphaeroforma arctica JP610]
MLRKIKTEGASATRLGYTKPRHITYAKCLDTAREILVAMAEAEGQPAFAQATPEEQLRRTSLTRAQHEQGLLFNSYATMDMCGRAH